MGDHALGQPLRGPHHIGRAHRLVGGDQDEAPRAEIDRRLGHVPGAEDVVARHFVGRDFAKRHVLVGGAVEHNGRAPLLEDAPDLGFALGVGQDQRHAPFAEIAAQFGGDFVQAVFAAPHHQQRFGRQSESLAADFGADRAARSGDEHALAAQIIVLGVQLQLYRLAAEQVLDAHRTQFFQRRAPFQHLLGAGQALDARPGVPAALGDFLHLAWRRRGQRDDDLAGAARFERGLQRLESAQNAHAVNRTAAQRRVFVDEAHGAAIAAATGEQFARHGLAPRPCADDQHPRAAMPGPDPGHSFGRDPPRQPGRPRQAAGHRPGQRDDRHRHALQALDALAKDVVCQECDRGNGRGAGDQKQLAQAGEARDASIQAEREKHRHMARGDPGGKRSVLWKINVEFGVGAEIEAQQIRQQESGGRQSRVGRHHPADAQGGGKMGRRAMSDKFRAFRHAC
ncbi:MAG: hypothetical protein BWZ10_02431 [candidate division BRC1 bacterium ADurb.BinA364]|nr:MAG: hypothetical protein BWZ10_02431 [candidate division BRC1 bacterium ADurb.BinA364]